MATISNYKLEKGKSNLKNPVLSTRLSKVQVMILSSAVECTKNTTLRPLAQKGCAPLSHVIEILRFFILCSVDSHHHQRYPKFARWRHCIQVYPSKAEDVVFASETGHQAAVEPPSSLSVLTAVALCPSVVILIDGREVHSVVVLFRVSGSANEGITGISAVS